MNEMSRAKALLLRLRFAADELQQLYRMRAAIYEMLTNTTTRPSPTGVRGGGDVHRLDVLGELQGRVDEQIRALAALRVEAMDAIYRLDDSAERAVLMAYYVNCRNADGSVVTWDDVAAQLHVSRRQVLRIHVEALASLEKVGIECHPGAVV